VAAPAQRTLSDTARAPCDLLSGKPCHPSFCGLFHRGPCFPQYLPPLGQDLRLTIETDDDNDPSARPDAEAGARPDRDRELDSIGAMYAALRTCWVPPRKDAARHGMEYTVRFALKRDGAIIAPPRRTYVSHDAPQAARDTYGDAIAAALERCMPLHFSAGMGGAVAGRPIAVRFVDRRTIERADTPHDDQKGPP
jgi:hypothetical protein